MYYFIAITCDDLTAPPNSHVIISHGIATVTCDINGLVDTLECVGHKWIGEVQPCLRGGKC